MQVRPGVHTFDLEWEYDEPLSVHVIETEEGTVLFGGDAEFLEEAGIEPDHRLEDGERFFGAIAISIPDHTPDNMAYLHDGVLIAGDSVAGAESDFAADGDWSGPLAVTTPDFDADDERARTTVTTPRDHDVEVILVSHGANVTEDGNEAIETLLADLGV